MSIDWVTVAAQIANFLVLVWLLKRFLYRPILDGIDAREAEIANRMAEAVVAKESALATEADYHEQVRSLHVAQAEMSETIRKAAEQQRDTLLADAQQRMEKEQTNWSAHLDKEARTYAARMQRAGAHTVLSLTRKALTDLADETLEERMARHLIQQLAPMVDDVLTAAGGQAVAVFSSHDPLPEHVSQEVTVALKGLLPNAVVTFETDATQSPGLILRVGGAQLAWTVDTYIDGLETQIDAQLVSGGTVRVSPHDQ